MFPIPKRQFPPPVGFWHKINLSLNEHHQEVPCRGAAIKNVARHRVLEQA